MTRTELEHVIRAAAAVCGEKEVIVMGSQAILAEHPDCQRSVGGKLRRFAILHPRGAPGSVVDSTGNIELYWAGDGVRADARGPGGSSEPPCHRKGAGKGKAGTDGACKATGTWWENLNDRDARCGAGGAA